MKPLFITTTFRILKSSLCLVIFYSLLCCSSNDNTPDTNVVNDIKSGTWNGSNKLESPLQSAVFHNSVKYLNQLIEAGHDLSFVDSEQKNLLHIAARYSDVTMNAFLIQNGVDINKKDEQLWTPLNYACRYNRAEVVKLYVDHGVNLKNLSHNPISNALTGAHNGMMDIIRILADNGFNLNDSSADPVHRAVAYDMPTVVSLMIEKGADYKRVSDNGWNYLHWSAYYGSTDCAEYFKQFDALRTLTPVEYKNEIDEDSTILYPAKLSAIDIAKMNRKVETVEVLD